MTYAVVLILIVSLLVSVLLMTAQLTAKSSQSYQNYIDSKNYLDKVGSAAVAYYTDENYTDENNSGGGEEWENAVKENDFGYTIEINGDSDSVKVYVLNSKKIELYIKFTKNDATDETDETGSGYALSAYIYNYGYKTQQEDQQTS